MIQPHVVANLERWSEFYGASMLMLGATGSNVPEYPTARDFFGRWVGSYADLDLDPAAKIQEDLNRDLASLSQGYDSVFNLGTIEHVWNQHNAWANALRAVAVGGHFLSHGPVNGWINHGLFMANPGAVRAFVAKNGFEVVDEFNTKWRQQGEVLWLAARKVRHIEDLSDYEPAWQIYEQGNKKAVR